MEAKYGHRVLEFCWGMGRHLVCQVCNLTEDVFIPRHCPICGQVLNREEKAMCIYCMTQLPYTTFPSSTDNPMTRRLWAAEDVERATSLFYYHSHSVYSRLVINIKYLYNPVLAVQAGMMAAQLKRRDWDGAGVDCIVPVPIHWWRWCRRGYNQSERLAQGIGAVYHLPVVTDMLHRYKHSKPQARLQGSQRWTNAQNVYMAHVPPQWRGHHIMLVDDVCTTGATLISCIQALHQSDPTLTVSCFTLAMAGSFSSYRL